MKKYLIAGFVLLSIGAAWAYNLDTRIPLPGKTVANPKLQADTLLPVYTVALGNARKNCKTAAVVDTRVVRNPEHLVKNKKGSLIGGDWDEIWTVQACSKKMDIPVTFVLDKRGATYIIESSKIKFLE